MVAHNQMNMTISHAKYIFIGTGVLLLLLLVLGVVVLLRSDGQERDLNAPEDSQQNNIEGSAVQRERSEEEVSIVDPKPDDKDRDGLTDTQEQDLGTNERARDSDNDFISDGDEVLIYKTNPLEQDSDGDGFSDFTEIRNGYNPNGDGLLNDNQ